MQKLKEDEKIEDLGEYGLKIIQAKNAYRFTQDAILLVKFVRLKNDEKIMDLGSGSGIIPVLLSYRRKGLSIYGIEIQEELADMSKRSVNLNKLQDSIHIINEDIKNVKNLFKSNQFDVVVSNPPYISLGKGIISSVNSRSIARHELKCNLDDIISSSNYLLKNKGRIYLIFKSSRLIDLILILNKYGIEAKVIKFIHFEKKRKADVFLVEGVKGGKRELKVEKPIFIQDE
jgi:tRNA1Val (adenine37-N6)-methyltransferase